MKFIESLIKIVMRVLENNIVPENPVNLGDLVINVNLGEITHRTGNVGGSACVHILRIRELQFV